MELVVRNNLFKKIKKQHKSINDAFINSPPFFVKDIFDNLYVGYPEDYEYGELILYFVYKLDAEKQEWKKLPKEGSDGETFDWFVITKAEIDSIFIPDLQRLGLEHISLEDAMILWYTPNHTIQRSIKCEWDGENKTHSKYCDSEIHEILFDLYTKAYYKNWKDLLLKFPNNSEQREEKSDEFSKRFSKLVYYIIQHGGKIPGQNF